MTEDHKSSHTSANRVPIAGASSNSAANPRLLHPMETTIREANNNSGETDSWRAWEARRAGERRLNSQLPLSRRQFTALSVLGTVGFWLAFSSTYAPRMFRTIVMDTARSVRWPDHTPQPTHWNPNTITAAWLGHSSVLINFFGLTILTDPVLFMRIGADLRLATVGPKRLIAPALNLHELPPINLVLLSHAHMDHLDLPTLKRLPATTRAVTAHNTADLLAATKLHPATELRWGDHTTVRTEHGDIKISAFEVKHWGARWRRDTYRGYNGYVLEREGKKIIFGGDTALTDTFRPLRPSGPYELAIMPIGAYKPWVVSHCTPEQSLRMADDAGAAHILPIHHQTFKLGQEHALEPIQRLEAALAPAPTRLGWRDVGQTFQLA